MISLLVGAQSPLPMSDWDAIVLKQSTIIVLMLSVTGPNQDRSPHINRLFSGSMTIRLNLLEATYEFER